MTHYIILVANENLAHWIKEHKNNHLMIKVPIGSPITKPSQQVMCTGDGKIIEHVNGVYLYQSGNYYVRATRQKGNSIEGNITNEAPGVFKHSIIPIGNKEILVSGKFSENDRLSIV